MAREFMRHRTQQGRIRSLRTGVVLQTLDGAAARVAAMSVADQMLLCSYFECDVDELHRKLWTGRRERSSTRKRRRSECRHSPPAEAAPQPEWYKQHPIFQEMQT